MTIQIGKVTNQKAETEAGDVPVEVKAQLVANETELGIPPLCKMQSIYVGEIIEQDDDPEEIYSWRGINFNYCK